MTTSFQAGILLYNLSLLALDGLLIYRAFREPRPWACAKGALLLTASASVLAASALDLSVFAAMRLLALALFVHVPLVLAGSAAALIRRARRPALGFAVAALLLELLASYAFYVEPYWLEVSRVRLQSKGLSQSLKIVVVSDLQTDQIGDYERDVLRRIQAENADLVLMTGDYLQTPGWAQAEHSRLEQELQAALAEAGLHSPLGVYAVQGDTERSGWPRIFAGSGVTPLVQTQTLKLGDLCVTGLTRKDSFDRSLRIPHCGAYHVVFGHSPDFALGSVDADLLVAGHTHGGQVQLPFIGPLITFSWVPRAWASGVTALDGGRTLVVSRGIGMERGHAPRLRFLCRPQLVVLELEPGP